MPLKITGVPVDATQIDVLYADPKAADRGSKAWGELGFKLLKTVDVASLTVVSGKHVIPLSKGEDMPGRAFDVQAVKEINGNRYASKQAGFDYHNRAPVSDGVIKFEWFVGEKGARIDLSNHLYDPDSRPATMSIIAATAMFGKDALPAWAALEGTELVIDAGDPRVESTVAIRITDEKGATAILDVVVSVLMPDAPEAPSLVEYVAA